MTAVFASSSVHCPLHGYQRQQQRPDDHAGRGELEVGGGRNPGAAGVEVVEVGPLGEVDAEERAEIDHRRAGGETRAHEHVALAGGHRSRGESDGGCVVHRCADIGVCALVFIREAYADIKFMQTSDRVAYAEGDGLDKALADLSELPGTLAGRKTASKLRATKRKPARIAIVPKKLTVLAASMPLPR